VSLIIVIGGITYFTIAMNNPEGVALIAVPIIKVFTMITFPFVKLLSYSTKLILKVTGIKENEGERVSEDELRFMLKIAGTQGVLVLSSTT